MKRTVGAAGTLLVHLAVIVLIVVQTARVPAPPGHLGPADVRMIEATKKLRGTAPPMITVPLGPLAAGPAPAAIGAPCLHGGYVGIGVKRQLVGAIMEVGPGTPAEAAGLREGDIILNDDELGPDRYAVGTRLTLRILRDGREFRTDVVIGEICEG